MHGERHRADNAVAVIHQTDELADRGLSYQVERVVEPWVKMVSLAALNEANFAAEMIHDRLVIVRIPPFCGVVVFSAGDHDPEPPPVFAFLHLRYPCFLARCDDVSL